MTEWDGNLDSVLAYAALAHRGQKDKIGEPYIWHPIRVSLRLNAPMEKAIALLHDVVEDCSVTSQELADRFGLDIAYAVDVLSRRRGVTSDSYYRRIRKNKLALPVKLADIADNLDPDRLYKLDADTRRRLEKKYRLAIVALTGSK